MATAIQWTDETWNPTRGCSRKSDGCTRCYAEKQARRFAGPGGPYEGLLHANGSWNGKIMLVEDALDAPLHWRKPRRVFVDSMSDLFHENVPFDFVDKVFETMITNARHTFQILTKRPERMREYMRGSDTWPRRVSIDKLVPPNVWLGVSVENQETANERIPILLQTPAAVRFLSCEPLLGEVDLHCIDLSSDHNITINCPGRISALTKDHEDRYYSAPASVDWVIVGGESGPGARECTIGHVRRIVRDCKAAGVAVFCKQLGAKPVNREGVAHPLRDRKGGDMDEWPDDLRVREFPDLA